MRWRKRSGTAAAGASDKSSAAREREFKRGHYTRCHRCSPQFSGDARRLRSGSTARPASASQDDHRFVRARHRGFREFAIVTAASAFFQLLLDLTVEDALVKFGFRYSAAEDWSRLRRLFDVALRFKLAGGLLAGACLLFAGPLSPYIWPSDDLALPLLVVIAPRADSGAGERRRRGDHAARPVRPARLFPLDCDGAPPGRNRDRCAFRGLAGGARHARRSGARDELDHVGRRGLETISASVCHTARRACAGAAQLRHLLDSQLDARFDARNAATLVVGTAATSRQGSSASRRRR